MQYKVVTLRAKQALCLRFFSFFPPTNTFPLQSVSERWCLPPFSQRQLSSSWGSDPKSNRPLPHHHHRHHLPSITRRSHYVDRNSCRRQSSPRIRLESRYRCRMSSVKAKDPPCLQNKWCVFVFFFVFLLDAPPLEYPPLPRFRLFSRAVVDLYLTSHNRGVESGSRRGVCCCFYSYFFIKLSTWRWELLDLCSCHVK